MRLRSALLASLVAALAAAVPSNAALPKTCNLVSDPTGDGAQDRVDIVSADIATGPTELVAVVRVKNMAKDTSLLAPTHRYRWQFQAYLGPVLFAFDRYEPWMQGTPLGGQPSASASVNGRGVALKMHKVSGNQVIWVLDRKNLPELNKKKNQKFDKIHAVTNFDDPSDDSAITKKIYTDKQPSCVVAK